MLKAQNQVCGVRKRVVGPAAPLAWPLAAHCRTIRSSASNACHAAPRRWWSAAGLRLCAAVRPLRSSRVAPWWHAPTTRRSLRACRRCAGCHICNSSGCVAATQRQRRHPSLDHCGLWSPPKSSAMARARVRGCAPQLLGAAKVPGRAGQASPARLGNSPLLTGLLQPAEQRLCCLRLRRPEQHGERALSATPRRGPAAAPR